MLSDAVVEKGPGDVYFGGQFGEHELGVLETGDRGAERVALPDVIEGVGQDSFGAGHRADPQRKPLLGQIAHQLIKALPGWPSRFSAGTRMSVKLSSEVSWACSPILARLRPR